MPSAPADRHAPDAQGGGRRRGAPHEVAAHRIHVEQHLLEVARDRHLVHRMDEASLLDPVPDRPLGVVAGDDAGATRRTATISVSVAPTSRSWVSRVESSGSPKPRSWSSARMMRSLMPARRKRTRSAVDRGSSPRAPTARTSRTRRVAKAPRRPGRGGVPSRRPLWRHPRESWRTAGRPPLRFLVTRPRAIKSMDSINMRHRALCTPPHPCGGRDAASRAKEQDPCRQLPLTVIRRMRSVGDADEERHTRSLPTLSTSSSICWRFPAMVTSCTGWTRRPFSIQCPTAPCE